MGYRMSFSTSADRPANKLAYGHAVVIGGSMAGLTAARVLLNHFERVTIIERDRLPAGPEFRKGVPQARHPHVLLLRGQQILEELFPGLRDELLDQDAVPINFGNEMHFQMMGKWLPHYQTEMEATACSRPLLEGAIRQRLAAYPQLSFCQESEVTGLVADMGGSWAGKRVTGVQIRSRSDGSTQEIAADLVIDASGRHSNAPAWLTALGYTPPQETTVNAFAGYATRIYECPADFAESWKILYVMPAAPENTRGGIILPLEGNRWHVCLVGMSGDYPPTDEESFLAFARSLPSDRIYEAIKDARPLTDPYGFRQAENRLRHYDELPRYLDGFLVFGDAVYALNPVYAQGMTVAAISTTTLDECLSQQRERNQDGDLSGLAAQFQKELGKVIMPPWQLATGEDMRWPATEGKKELGTGERLIQGYMGRVMRAMPHNVKVTDAFYHVQHMIAPPTLLMRPDILLQVVKTNMQLGRSA
ncbi:MAG: FAD-dependent monooxygenase [Chloroflexi bacterium]|nr:FAD-dependent monooxygenase [Chloroflexota bacterium]MCI0580565.1 FAD-dependent monooxygenase [Chloroflexota bacterium]MCI0647597.1 FAD-dependent monooxygenase [Chloroflexota bacterium]MCI0730674.1 FAD-dependent monooxygenase [Chloroflexota bacterium]